MLTQGIKMWYNKKEVRTLDSIKEIEEALIADTKARQRKDRLVSMSGLGFSDEEKEILYDIYIGGPDSPYFKTVKSFEGEGKGVIVSKSMKKYEENFLSRQIAKVVLGRIQGKGLDCRHGSGGRSDVIAIVEDAFKRAVDAYQVPPNSNLREELLKKKENKNYVMERKSINRFNSFLAAAIKHSLITFIKKEGKYEVVDEIDEEVKIISKDGKETILKKSTPITEYVVDKEVCPTLVSIPIGEPDEDSEEVTGYLEVSNYSSLVENNFTIEAYVDDEREFELKRMFTEVYEEMSKGDRLLLLNSPEICAVLDKEQLIQTEICKIVGVTQGTISGLVRDSFSRFISKIIIKDQKFFERARA